MFQRSMNSNFPGIINLYSNNILMEKGEVKSSKPLKVVLPIEEDSPEMEYKRRKFLTFGVAFCMICSSLSLTFILFNFVRCSYYESHAEINSPESLAFINSDEVQNTTQNTDTNTTAENIVNNLRILSRDEWLAQPPNNELSSLELPVERVILTATATESCSSQASCTFRARYIQTFHMESRNWDDIAYNFLIGGKSSNAFVLEGRGWDKKGAHTKGFNNNSICIAFIGSYARMPPTVEELNAAQTLIAEGVRLGKINPDYKLNGRKDFTAGNALHNVLETWPHWSGKI